MWQSHAFGGALSFGSSVPADQGTVSACPAAASNPPATIAPMALRKPLRASMEPSSRGAKRRGDPESQGALRSPGLLRFARNDDGGSVQSQHLLERRSCLSSLRSGGSPLTGAIRLRQSRAASKSRTRDLLADATIRAMSARRTGKSSVSNQGLRLSQALLRQEGWGMGARSGWSLD